MLRAIQRAASWSAAAGASLLGRASLEGELPRYHQEGGLGIPLLGPVSPGEALELPQPAGVGALPTLPRMLRHSI